MARKSLRKRYGHARGAGNEWDVKYPPWVEALKGKQGKGSCLWRIVKAALDARKTAKDENGDPLLIGSADKALQAIRNKETKSVSTACKAASAALQKYVEAWGGSSAEADVLLP
jgi:hypothetical protein